MKKLGLLVLVAGIILMAGCAGDDPSGPSGTLPTVTGLEIGAASAGRDVVLAWDAVTGTDVDGYKLYFREEDTGTWAEVADVTTNTATHGNATAAGYYAVKAYEGSDYSENNSNIVNTLPSDVTATYTIYDNYSPIGQPSGFIFGETTGQTGSASSTEFDQDIYAFDEDTPLTGDDTVWLYSGNFGSFGNGNQTYMYEPVNNSYCEEYSSGNWFGQSYELYTSDQRVFLARPINSGEYYHYVKMYNVVVAPDPATENGTMVSFSYEYQTIADLTLFSSK